MGLMVNRPQQEQGSVSLWCNRDFMLLRAGQTVSVVGSGVSGLAFPLLVLALTHSAAVSRCRELLWDGAWFSARSPRRRAR